MNSFFTRPQKTSSNASNNDVLRSIRIKSAIAGIQAIADAIRDLKEVPSGELYASVMQYLTLSQYEHIINILLRSKVITRENNLLKWSIEHDTQIREGT